MATFLQRQMERERMAAAKTPTARLGRGLKDPLLEKRIIEPLTPLAYEAARAKAEKGGPSQTAAVTKDVFKDPSQHVYVPQGEYKRGPTLGMGGPMNMGPRTYTTRHGFLNMDHATDAHEKSEGKAGAQLNQDHLPKGMVPGNRSDRGMSGRGDD